MPTFKKYQPLALRVWHWLDALAISGLLGTVLLRKTFLSWRANAAFFQQELAEVGTPITPELAKELAVGLRDPLWEWHYRFGFTLVGLVVLRALVAVALPSERPFAAAARTVRALLAASPRQRPAAAHHALVKLGYALFYLCLLFMVISGPLMFFEDRLGLGEDLVHTVEEVHESTMWFFVVFAAVHVVGVVVEELRGAAGIVSDMINGGRRG